MKLLFRILLLLGMLFLAYQTSIRYAFAFHDGYPILPLIALGFCFTTYVKLRPPHAPNPMAYDSRSTDPILILLLAVSASAYLLNVRGEHAFTLIWFLHLCSLTFFALLVPFIAGYASGRAKNIVATLTALLLAVMFWKGTEMNSQRSKMSQGSCEFENTSGQLPGRSV